MKTTYSAILDAALQLAQIQPYDKITYSDIAKRAGVHRSTVQRYFGSKDRMRRIILEHLTNQDHILSDTRTKILDSAEKMFAKFGFQGATLDDVAKEAGLTKGAVYWHFSSKQDLYLALCERSLRRLLRGLPEQIQEIFSSPDVKDKLKNFFADQFAACEKEGGQRPMLFFEFISSGRNDSIRKKLCDSFSELFEETARILRKLQSERLINDEVDAHDLSIALHSFVNGVVLMWLIAPNQVSFPTLAETMSEMILNGISEKIE